MAKHLIGAVRDFLLGNAALAAQLPGGIADGMADRDKILPYLILESKDMASLRIMGGREIQTHRVELTVCATTRSAAESVGNAARDLVLPPDDSPAWAPLALADGWRDLNRQPAGGDAVEIDPEERAAYGRDVWTCRRPISWSICRG